MLKKIVLFILITMLMYSCTCKKETYIPNAIRGLVKLKGTLSDTNWILKQNDTLFYTVTIPDSIKIERFNQADTTIKFKYLEDANTTTCYGIIDTARKSVDCLSDFIIVKGRSNSKFIYYFDKTKQPNKLKIGILLSNIGYYEFYIKTNPGFINANGNIETNLNLDFDVKNKHIDSVRRFFGDAWADDAIDRGITRGLGTYAFKV